MGTLQSALAWAARGFAVFPLVPNGKEPAFDDAWYELATVDPVIIRSWWTDPVLRTERDFNVGVDCTGRVVVDIDVKEGKDGYNQYCQLGGTFDTLTVRTPTGGLHLYFEGEDSSNAPIARDVDIRSHHGYVVGPGSIINGATYEVVRDVAPLWTPYALSRLLREPYERADLSTMAPIDSPAGVEAGIRYLQSAPVAVEGQRGDEVTFVTAARLVRELALSEQTAFALLRDHWNDRCLPPWSLDELLHKVENAAAYGSADFARLDPSVMYAGVHIEPPPTMFEVSGVTWGNALAPSAMPPRPWIIDRMLLLHETTLLLAPGSAGKSVVALAIAAHLAVGKDFAGYTTHTQCKSIVYNGEDDITEQSRRLLAVCMAYNLDFETVKSQILLLSPDNAYLNLVTSAGRVATPNEEVIRQFVELASDPEVGLCVFDPLVDIHEVDEGDNPQMNKVMGVLRRVAREANVAMLVPHHTTKAGSTRQEDRIGNMDIGRGASGIVYKARIAFTLLNASQQDAEDYGLQEEERLMYVRLDDAKMNSTAATGNAMWFRKEGLRLPNGDVVGALKHVTLSKSVNALRLRVAGLLVETLETNGSASMTMPQVVALLKANEPLWANKTDPQIRQRVEGMFQTTVEYRGKRLRVVREEGARGATLLTMS